MTISEVLHDAADILESIGWCQGGIARNAKGDEIEISSSAVVEFCAMGAIHRAAWIECSGIEDKALSAFCDKLVEWHKVKPDPRLIDNVENTIGKWNDAKNRTKKQVVDMLRDVAAEVE